MHLALYVFGRHLEIELHSFRWGYARLGRYHGYYRLLPDSVGGASEKHTDGREIWMGRIYMSFDVERLTTAASAPKVA